MHVKFIARGTGSARAPADYLLTERDVAAQPRAGVEVLPSQRKLSECELPPQLLLQSCFRNLSQARVSKERVR